MVFEAEPNRSPKPTIRRNVPAEEVSRLLGITPRQLSQEMAELSQIPVPIDETYSSNQDIPLILGEITPIESELPSPEEVIRDLDAFEEKEAKLVNRDRARWRDESARRNRLYGDDGCLDNSKL